MATEHTANGQASVIVAVKTANYIIKAEADNGKVISNQGAVGVVIYYLPVAEIGLRFGARLMANQPIRIDPNGTETIGLPSSGAQGAAGKYLTADAIGEWINLECIKAGEWFVAGYAGTWAAEA